MNLMIRTFEERWNVEYLSGVTNKVVELVSVSSIHLRKRANIPEPPDINDPSSGYCRPPDDVITVEYSTGTLIIRHFLI
jgi:hypothetical protein